jgi:hypothetical protein
MSAHTINNECLNNSRQSIHADGSKDLFGNTDHCDQCSVVARKRNGSSHTLVAWMLVARSAWGPDSNRKIVNTII